MLWVLTNSRNTINIFQRRDTFYSLNLLKNECVLKAPLMEVEAPDSHQSVTINREPTPTLLRWPPVASLDPFNNCLLLDQRVTGVFCRMSAHNELLYTQAVIIKRHNHISHLYCLLSSQSISGGLYIISFMIKQITMSIKDSF